MATAFRAELTLGVLPYSSPLSSPLSEKIDQDVMNPPFSMRPALNLEMIITFCSCAVACIKRLMERFMIGGARDGRY
jgi:hypothetical protein